MLTIDLATCCGVSSIMQSDITDEGTSDMATVPASLDGGLGSTPLVLVVNLSSLLSFGFSFDEDESWELLLRVLT